MLNDFIKFRITIIKSYLKKSNTFIQDLIQDFIQNFIQDFIQDLIQSENLIQLLEDNTSRRNPPRPRQRLIRFQNNMIDITIYIFKFISSLVNF